MQEVMLRKAFRAGPSAPARPSHVLIHVEYQSSHACMMRDNTVPGWPPSVHPHKCITETVLAHTAHLLPHSVSITIDCHAFGKQSLPAHMAYHH